MNRSVPSFEVKHGIGGLADGERLTGKGSQLLVSRNAFIARLNPILEEKTHKESSLGHCSSSEGPAKPQHDLAPTGTILVGKARISEDSVIIWMYKGERGWTPFSEGNSIYIESKYKSGAESVLIYPYQIDFFNFVQTNLLTGTERCVLRGDKHYLPLGSIQSTGDPTVPGSFLNILSSNTSEVIRNLFNLALFENKTHLARHGGHFQTLKNEFPAPDKSGGKIAQRKIVIPRLALENCQRNLSTESEKNTVSSVCPSLSPGGEHMVRSPTNSRSNANNKCKYRVNSCSRVVICDAVGAGSALSRGCDEKDGTDNHSDGSVHLEDWSSGDNQERQHSSFFPPANLDEAKAETETTISKIYLHNILGNSSLSKGAKFKTDSSFTSSSVFPGNNSVGVLDEASRDNKQPSAPSKTTSGSKSLFFFTPHKYRKSVGIIVPRILSCKFNSKKATKTSETGESSKFVRFNCSFISPDQSKHSLGGYISTPRRICSKASKESGRPSKKGGPEATGKAGNSKAKEAVAGSPTLDSPETHKSHYQASPVSSSTSTVTSSPVQTNNLKAFSVKSAFIVLGEDAIPFDISAVGEHDSVFGELERGGGYGYERNEDGGGYLSVLNTWDRIGRVGNEFFETMSESEFSSRRMSMSLNDLDDEEAASDTEARFLLDEDSRKLISLGDFDSSTGIPRPINWWFNHSVRHITVKLNCECNSLNRKKTSSLEIIPLLKPLLTGYMNERTPIIEKLCPDAVHLSGVSSHVLLGLKSLEIIGLRPNKRELPRISEFCFTELNNIIPISLEELYIVQSIIPISIFSLLLTRFPVPAASTFSFSLICNDDELPNTGLQTIQVINLHLSQNPCSHIKRRSRYGKSKGRRHLTYSGDSACSHVHLDIFRMYNHVKICPWLAISNFVDEFVLRTPILVKCIIDSQNIMVVPSINTKNLRDDSRSLYDHRADPLGNYSASSIGELPRDAEFVILTANLILPLLIIQSHSIQNVIIGGEVEDFQCEHAVSKTVTKLRVDSMVFSCKCLPFKFFRVRNLDLFLDLNIDKTELGVFIRNNSKNGAAKPPVPFARAPDESGQTSDQDRDNYCFQQLYDSIDSWICEFSTWLDKYVCCGSIEILRVNLYVTSRYLELKVNSNTNNSNLHHPVHKYGSCANLNHSSSLDHNACDLQASQLAGSGPEKTDPEPMCLNYEDAPGFDSERNANTVFATKNSLNFDPLYHKFLAKSKANHSSLKNVVIKICISSHLQNFILKRFG